MMEQLITETRQFQDENLPGHVWKRPARSGPLNPSPEKEAASEEKLTWELVHMLSQLWDMILACLRGSAE